jgi:YD repeat-containing protein
MKQQPVLAGNSRKGIAFPGCQYDGAAKRVTQILPGGTTVYVYDALGQLAAEYSTAPSGTSPCATCFISVDHLGSTRLALNPADIVIIRYYIRCSQSATGSVLKGRLDPMFLEQTLR